MLLPEPPPSPPRDVDELLARARALSGQPLERIARRYHLSVPTALKRHKGWVGAALELALGARGHSKPQPDFEHLGVELKTIPIGVAGRPRESTYVCMVPLDVIHDLTWETSHVLRKLRCVLWIPVQASPELPIGARQIGSALLWRLDADPEAATIRKDWEDLSAQVRLGWIDDVTGHRGEILQIRPKALTRRETRLGVGEEGWLVPMQPRGWYLRASFTARVLGRHYADARAR